MQALDRSPHRLRLLHLSDLHERGAREDETWRRRRVLGPAWEENLQALLQDGPIDLVCFTGDVADRGREEEYTEATALVQALLERLRLASDRFFVIPGNHDVDRRIEPEAWRSLRQEAARADPLELSRRIAGKGAPAGIDQDLGARVLARQGAFRRWVRRTLGRGDLDPESSPHGTLGYRATLGLRGWAFPVHVVGADTAWLSGDGSDAGRLWLTEDQLMRLATAPDGGPLPGLRLLLMHHPFHDLADGARCRRLLDSHVDLVLRGHLHEAELETWSDPDREVRVLAAGCLYETARADHHPNACQVVTLDLDRDGRLLRTEVRLRSWSARGGHWFDDDGLYKGSQEGRVVWCRRPPARHAGTNPYDPWTPVEPADLVGRSAVLRSLSLSLTQGRSLSLVGDWRIGKTSILDAWAAQASAEGRRVVRLTGEGPEGVSPARFVRAVTGVEAPEVSDGAADLLRSWAERTAPRGSPPLLLVDEADSLLVRFEHRFFERLRGMLGTICFVLASRRELDLIYQEVGRTSPFHNRLQLLWVGLLEREAAERLIGRAGPWLGGEEADLLRSWAGCHPFHLQLLGWHLVESRRHGEGPGPALERYRTEAGARLREIWRVLDEREREALREAAQGLPSTRRSLRVRGLTDGDGRPFGRVLTAWLEEEEP